MRPIPEEWNELFLRDECRRFAKYWLGLQVDRLVPPRSGLKPEQIRDLLPFLTLIERISDHELRFRLVGTAVVSRCGFDNTGTTFSVRNFRDDSPFIKTLLGVLDRPCGFYIIGEERYKSGLKSDVELLGFPLSDASGTPRFIATLSHECTKRYSNILHGTGLNEMVGQVHRFLDIGAGMPESVGGSFIYTPKSPTGKVDGHQPALNPRQKIVGG